MKAARRTRLARFLPKTVAGQVIALLILTLLGLHLVVTTILVIGGGNGELPPPGGKRIEAASLLADILDITPPAERPGLLARLPGTTGLAPRLLASLPPDATLREEPGPPPGDAAPSPLPARPIWHWKTGDGDRKAFLALAENGYLEVDDAAPMPPPGIAGPVIVTVVFLLFGGTFLVVWTALAITAPLREVARAADSFDGSGEPLAEIKGPAEVRSTVAALRRMQQRVRRLLDDRTRMIAAVSHDLRTPITRLRLRAELIENPEIREPMLADLAHMSALAAAALAHLRDGQDGETMVRVDLTSLVETTVEAFADIGAEVSFSGPPRATAILRPHALRRALDNLIENALTHAGSAAVSIRETADQVAIEVADTGPGIPAEDRERLTAPFARGDEARSLEHPPIRLNQPDRKAAAQDIEFEAISNRPDGPVRSESALDEKPGFGLGLSIARAIAEGHGGELELADNAPTGLVARLILPRHQQQG